MDNPLRKPNKFLLMSFGRLSYQCYGHCWYIGKTGRIFRVWHSHQCGLPGQDTGNTKPA